MFAAICDLYEHELSFECFRSFFADPIRDVSAPLAATSCRLQTGSLLAVGVDLVPKLTALVGIARAGAPSALANLHMTGSPVKERSLGAPPVVPGETNRSNELAEPSNHSCQQPISARAASIEPLAIARPT